MFDYDDYMGCGRDSHRETIDTLRESRSYKRAFGAPSSSYYESVGRFRDEEAALGLN